MSESELSSQQPVFSGVKKSGAKLSQVRLWLAIVLGGLMVACTVLLANSLSAKLSLGALVVLGFASSVGLIGVMAYLLGFIHFGRLPQQRAFFENLIDGLEESCVVSDRRGSVVFSNNYYQKMLAAGGQTRTVGFENLYSGHPSIAEKIYRLSQAANEGKKHVEDIRFAAGSSAVGAQADRPVWLELSVSPIGEDGDDGRQSKNSYALWRLRDVSAAKSEQETAFSQLQYIINYLDHAPAGFFSTRANGDVVYVNATLADWLGLELGATSDGDIKLSDFLSKDDAQLLLDLKPGLSEATTQVFDFDLVAKNPTADGKAAPAPFPVRIIHRADFDEKGAVQPSRSLVLDMRESNISTEDGGQKLSRLINNAPFAIADLNRDGVVIRSNTMFSKLGDVATRGAKITDLVDDKNIEGLTTVFEDAVNSTQAGSKSIAVTFKGKDERTANIVFARYRRRPEENVNLSRKDGCVFAYVVDTSEHSSLEEQLAQSQKMQAVGQLAGGVAHDFNNVLTAIIGFSDLLLAKHRPTDPSFADIMNIKQNANRAANLVRQLLAFSRRQTLRTEVISLSDVMSDLGNLLGRLLGETIDLDMVYGRDLWYVNVDMNQFEQVVINLAVNARDAMDMKGALILRTSNVSIEESRSVSPDIMPEGEYVLTEVIDNGSGMPPEVIAKIYEPFFSTKDVGKGTGLGLSTVYGIVKQTGGFIFCESEVGRGTTFKIYLPRVDAPVEVEEVKDEKIDVKKADMTGDARILLVEDEDAVRAFASRALATRGFKVVEADSGERGLEIIDSDDGEFDLVLSDVVMPEMDGPTMLKEIRKRGIKTKFIFISGYAEDAFEKNLEGATDFAFLAKPFSLKQLTEAVQDALRS